MLCRIFGFRVLRSLQAFLRGNQALALFTGEQGVGKRSLLQQWLRYGRVKMPVIHILASQQLQPLKLIEMLADQCKISLQLSSTPSAALKELFNRLVANDKCHLLMIDCAEEIPLTSLAVLFELLQMQSDDNPFFKVIITLNKTNSQAAQQLLDDTLTSAQVLKISIQPGSLADTRNFLQHKLRSSGLNASYELADAAVAKIYQLSSGVPAKINKLVSRIRPQELLAPVVSAEDAMQSNSTLGSGIKRFFAQHNIQAYALGLLMSLSMVFMIMQRPAFVPGVNSDMISHKIKMHALAGAGRWL